MIKGAKYWNDATRTYYIQTNNPTDTLLKKILKKFTKYYLESCGPTAACMCLAALGYVLTIETPGGYKPQPEEVLFDWLNDPKTQKIRDKIRPGVSHLPGNRIPQFYPAAVQHVFGDHIKARFAWEGSNWDKITGYLKEGRTVQLQLKRPGHYIAFVAYDEESQEIIYNDPWPERTGKGFNLRMSKAEFERNIESFCVVYSG